MQKNVAIITTEKNGDSGISLFTCYVAKAIEGNGCNVFLFSPDINSIPSGDNSYKYHIKLPVRTTRKEIKKIYEKILNLNIKNAIFTGVGYCASQIVLFLEKKGIDCMVCVHDAIDHERKLRLVKRIVGSYAAQKNRKMFAKVKNIILLSPLSLRDFNVSTSDKYQAKTILFTLGAHPPLGEPIKPKEIGQDFRYLLFFGRIEPYKDLATLTEAYLDSNAEEMKLIIAGSGEFDEITEKNIEKSSKIISINRFVTNAETLYLFQHAAAVVLPYISATQSGVLALSYYFGKPVIVSNVDHLTCFVEEGRTGFVYYSEAQLAKIISASSVYQFEKMKPECEAYCKKHFDWVENAKVVVSNFR